MSRRGFVIVSHVGFDSAKPLRLFWQMLARFCRGVGTSLVNHWDHILLFGQMISSSPLVSHAGHHSLFGFALFAIASSVYIRLSESM